MTTVGDTDAEYHGVDTNKATLLKSYTDKWRNACKLTSLTATTTYYFVVVTEDLNGKFSVSNEVATSAVVVPVTIAGNFEWYTDPTTGRQGMRVLDPDGNVLMDIPPVGA
jgi:hypothetical protein